MKKHSLLVILTLQLATFAAAQKITVNGSVVDGDTKLGLPYANVLLAGTTVGTATDISGKFSLTFEEKAGGGPYVLVISFVGYKTDTVSVTGARKNYRIQLSPDNNALNEIVVVSGTMKEVSKLNSPIPVEVYSPALFRKNPTPNIFESLVMVNGVQPQLNCNVCNTGDIHINGMEGPYTMVLIDGMPIVSSLSTVYGLSGIPNGMVKRIEVVKGPASTLYGSEAVAGIINIITREPATSPQFDADVSATTIGEYNADIATKWKAGKAEALLGINYFNFLNTIDNNDDNFTDLTQQHRISLFNKWDFKRQDNRLASVAFRFLYEDRWGGEMHWTKEDRGSGEVYGESIYTHRGEMIGSYQLPLNGQKMTFDYSYNYHLQDSYYGTVKYLADQHVGFAQLRWDKKLGNHDLLMGIPFRVISYDDNTVGTASKDTLHQENRPMQTFLPGLFIQDEMKLNPYLTLLAGVRYDRHNHHGNIFSPRLSAKFSPDQKHTFRLSTGNGFRVVNLFTEDHAALTGAREVIIRNELKPEQSWNVNLNYATQFSHPTGFIGLDASIFYTYFSNKITGDFMTDPELIIYDNLDGHAISKGVTVNADLAFESSLKVIAGITVMDVYQKRTSGDAKVKEPQLFSPVFSGTYAISYTLDKAAVTIDLTGRLNGPMHLPVVPNDYRPAKSPWYTLMNIQVTKAFSSGLELYAGMKNLLNFIPKDPLLRPFDPFDKNTTVNNPYGYTFDTSYNYAPIQGLKGFGGVRYTF